MEPTEAELAEEAKNEQENAAKVEVALDEALQSALKIAKAYPVAREKCEDNEKWQTLALQLEEFAIGSQFIVISDGLMLKCKFDLNRLHKFY